jgi:lysophospholipase L1-like esterase
MKKLYLEQCSLLLIPFLLFCSLSFGQNRKAYVDTLFIWDGDGTAVTDYIYTNLSPIVPRLLLPDTIYLAGNDTTEYNIYFDNICLLEDYQNYRWDVTCSVGAQFERGWTYTPTSATTTYSFHLDIYNNQDGLVDSGSSVISIVPGSFNTLMDIIFVGNSLTTNGTYPAEVLTLSDDSLDLHGTTGTPPNENEGQSGKTWSWFENNALSPFVLSSNVDFQNYLTTNGYPDPDIVTLHLGTNDIFSATDATIDATITTMLTYADSIINSIVEASADCRIGIAMIVPPSRSQDAFGTNYTTTQTTWQYKRNAHRYNEMLKAYYGIGGDGVNDNVYLIPVYMGLDTENNMLTTSTPYNRRNSTEYTRQTNGVHPATTGYLQMADWFFGFAVHGQPTPPAQYLVEEGFEGTGIPINWVKGGSETVDYEATPALLETESVEFADGGTTYLRSPDFGYQDEVWVSFTFTISALTGESALMYLRNSTDTGNAGWFAVKVSDSKFRFYHGTISTIFSTVTIVLGTQYYVWIHFTEGSGADGEAQVYISTTGTRPGTPEISSVNGNGVVGTGYLRFYDWTTISDYKIDGVRVSNVSFEDY